jgi:hypothetical protein
MSRLRKAGLAVAMGALVVAGSAIGGSLLSAGAATTGPTGPTGPSSTAPGTGHSNETQPHESSEPQAREDAENNGTARFGHAPDGTAPDGTFHPNENGGHEASEDPAREKAEHNGTATPGASEAAPPASSGSGTGTGI